MGHVFYLNVQSKPRVSNSDCQCGGFAEAKKSEHKLECFIVANQNVLCKLLNIDKLDRQLPVGVFKDRVSRDPVNEVFPKAHSAIDIWGVDKKTRPYFCSN